MHLSAELHGIRYGAPVQQDIHDMSALLAASFSRHEPLALAAGQTNDEIAAMVQLFGPQLLVEGLSLIARDIASGRIAGALLAKDLCRPLPPGLDRASPHFAPIGQLLDQLEEEYRAIRRVSPGAIMHLFMIGVDAEHERLGIGSTLTRLALEAGERSGYSCAIAEATNQKSKRILQHLGFQECCRVAYLQYRYCNQAVFATLAHHEAVVLMEKSWKSTLSQTTIPSQDGPAS